MTPDLRAALDVEPHPGKPHEFRNVCLRCGENGYLHVAIVTDLEVVRIESRIALTREEADRE